MFDPFITYMILAKKERVQEILGEQPGQTQQSADTTNICPESHANEVLDSVQADAPEDTNITSLSPGKF